jgi:SAM-dependent methyltransferase
LSNFAENPEDEGTIWFSDSGAEEKVVQHLSDLAEQGVITKGAEGSTTAEENQTSFLDIGTGNGHLLFALREDGFSGPMLGVDYSALSIKLAEQIESERQKKVEEDDDVEGSSAPVRFQVFDILASDSTLDHQFDVVLDKGTFDAISLSSEADATGRMPNELYRSKIVPFIKLGGRFVITSCNWTAEELRAWFEVADSNDQSLRYEKKLNYPTFKFQGKEGQTVVTLCFIKQGTGS